MSVTDAVKPEGRAAHPVRSRADYEDFLFNEAALLDEWRLDEWFALFAPGATYEVPTAGSAVDVQSDSALFYIADDYARLGHRVERLKKPAAHAEWPRSNCVRLVGNVRILGSDADGVQITSTFATYRSKHNVTDTYVGHTRYTIAEIDGELRIRAKRVLLGMNSLTPHGKISIIL
ncbi:MAG: aromatic-ring-hydroxylating dioxygenase subunit beta [Sphingobium sp.]